MEIYRIVRKKYSDVLSGKGASIKGGRWNSIGTEMIYCAANRSLAMAEVLVHLSAGTLPKNYMMLTLYVPDHISLRVLTDKELPPSWNVFPAFNDTQKIGDQFVVKRKFCLLKVPSAVTKGDFNLLINPFHPEFSKIKIVDQEDFPFDQRFLFNP